MLKQIFYKVARQPNEQNTVAGMTLGQLGTQKLVAAPDLVPIFQGNKEKIAPGKGLAFSSVLGGRSLRLDGKGSGHAICSCAADSLRKAMGSNNRE